MKIKWSKYSVFAVCVLLVGAIVATYWPVHDYDFVNYDDPVYITKNPNVQHGLGYDSVKWAFTTGYARFWHPMTWLSHMLDCQLFGMNPGGHHVTNLILHTANSLLLFLVLFAMTHALWPSVFVAAAFALHPLHVESVAWISERKGVLSTLFWILTMAAYHRYTMRITTHWYIITLLLFALGLMAKPMLVTLPFVLLLLDYWPLERIPTKESGLYWKKLWRLVYEKIPFFALSVAASVAAYLLQESGGALTSSKVLPFGQRAANALVSYAGYLAKLFYPSKLAVHYPVPLETPHMWKWALALLLLVSISVFVLFLAKRFRFLPIGWFWYVGTLVPVIGFIQVGGHTTSDRYTYITFVGLFVIIGWVAKQFVGRFKGGRVVIALFAGALLTGMFFTTRNQLTYWKDSYSLCSHALAVTRDNHIMHHNLARALQKKGKLDDAVEHYIRCLQIDPRYVHAYNNLGLALQEKGQIDAAIKSYRRALQIDPNYIQAYNNLGNVLKAKGRFDEAASFYRRALEIDSKHVGTYCNLGSVLKAMGDLNEAIECYQRALKINPASIGAHYNLGNALKKKGKLKEAVEHYQQALRLKPDWVELINNFAWLLATHDQPTVRDPDKAVKLAQRACELTGYQNAAVQDTLATAYAASGRLDEAISTAEKAIELARYEGNDALTQQIDKHLRRFKIRQSNTIQDPVNNSKD